MRGFKKNMKMIKIFSQNLNKLRIIPLGNHITYSPQLTLNSIPNINLRLSHYAQKQFGRSHKNLH